MQDGNVCWNVQINITLMKPFSWHSQTPHDNVFDARRPNLQNWILKYDFFFFIFRQAYDTRALQSIRDTFSAHQRINLIQQNPLSWRNVFLATANDEVRQKREQRDSNNSKARGVSWRLRLTFSEPRVTPWWISLLHRMPSAHKSMTALVKA